MNKEFYFTTGVGNVTEEELPSLGTETLNTLVRTLEKQLSECPKRKIQRIQLLKHKIDIVKEILKKNDNRRI